MAKRYWLMKTEPNDFSIDELKTMPGRTCHWDGVRNYKARNFMRDEMKIGDGVLFYHSRIDPSVVGLARVVKEGYPDHTAWDRKNAYYDPKSTREKPVWYMVDIEFEKKFTQPLMLGDLRKVPGLEKMALLKKGMRLSVQPVGPEEFKIILALAKKTPGRK